MINIKQETTLENLRKIQLTPPNGAGSYWKGLSHYQFVTTIMNAVLTRKWEIRDTKITLSEDKMDMIVCFSLFIPNFKLPSSSSLSIGIITSNAQRFGMKVYYGIVTADKIGVVLGKIRSRTKHTKGFDLTQEIYHILTKYKKAAEKTQGKVNKLMKKKISLEESEHILFEAGRKGVIPWSRIGQILALLAKRGCSTWQLYLAACTILQKSPIFKQLEQMNQFQKLLPKD